MSTLQILLKTTFLLLAGFLSFPSTAQQTLSAMNPLQARVKPHTLVFKLKPSAALVQEKELQQLLAPAQPRSLRRKFPHARPLVRKRAGETDLSLIYELEHAPELSTEKVKRRLLASGLMEYVEPLYQPAPLLQPNDPYADPALPQSQPNQYFLKLIQAYRAWDLAPGDSNIVIGILDTGVRLRHEDLQKQIKYNYADPIDGIDNDQDGYTDNFRGWDLADQDNNPAADGNAHGVMMSGISSATPQNGKGLAGVGLHTRFLPLKIYPSKTTGYFAGYEAIVYAADHGCQVINLSWGNPGFRSAFEQDIINYAAINKNVVIVAAAGNSAGELDFYPASYDHVLSVAATDDQDRFPSFFTNSHFIDLLAPGVRVYTTGNGSDQDYTFGTGTSFAAPVVAGAAALVRQRFPHYSALQVAEQLRMTADPVYDHPNNTPFAERLGRGRLNLYRAVSDTQVKALRAARPRVGTGAPLYPGDTVAITAAFHNLLAPLAGASVSLSCGSPYVTILQGSFPAGAMASGDSLRNAARPFQVYLHPDMPQNEVLRFRFGFADGSYQDYQYFKVTANPDFVTLKTRDLAVTITSKGNIGYNGFAYDQGEGVVYRQGPPLLSEGGLMVGLAPDKVSDNIRNEQQVSDGNFSALAPVRFDAPARGADQTASGLMQDAYPAAGNVGLKVSYRAFAWQPPQDRSFVIVEYKLTNTSGKALSNLYAGLFSDWDVGPATHNLAAWDSTHALGYVYSLHRPGLYAGVSLLTPLLPTHYAIDNAFSPAGSINLSDGFSTAEKYQALSSPHRQHQTAGLNGLGNDVSDVVGARLPDLAPGASVQVAFALLAGENLGGLQAGARAAQLRYRQLHTGPPPVAGRDSVELGGRATLRPAGGSIFRFYADSLGGPELGRGPTFATSRLAAPVTYYVSNADSLYESARVPYQVTLRLPQAFTLFPNPTTREAITLAIPAGTNTARELALEVLNLAGQVLLKGQLRQTGLVELKLPDLPNGMYLLRLRGGGSQETRRFQVLRQ
ncbi:MAG: S8 family serine peptidase [Adhaeribacter sp.]